MSQTEANNVRTPIGGFFIGTKFEFDTSEEFVAYTDNYDCNELLHAYILFCFSKARFAMAKSVVHAFKTYSQPRTVEYHYFFNHSTIQTRLMEHLFLLNLFSSFRSVHKELHEL